MKRIDEQIQEVIDLIENSDNISLDYDNIIIKLKKIKSHSEDWRIGFESLTPGGSEFYNDMDYCTKYVRDRYEDMYNGKKEIIRLQRRIKELTKSPSNICPECKIPHHPFDATNGERCWLVKGE